MVDTKTGTLFCREILNLLAQLMTRSVSQALILLFDSELFLSHFILLFHGPKAHKLIHTIMHTLPCADVCLSTAG